MSSKLFCPICGEQNVLKCNQRPNGGELFVGEEDENSIECFDGTIVLHQCGTCNAAFYTSDETIVTA